MKRRDLEKHLRAHGCEFMRHGGGHDVWINPGAGATDAIPRKNEVKNGTARSICKTLKVPPPRELR